jgi:hypothetical protein
MACTARRLVSVMIAAFRSRIVNRRQVRWFACPFDSLRNLRCRGRAGRILGDDQLSCQSLNKVVGEGRNAVDLAEEHLLAVEVVRLDVRVPRRRLRHEDPTAA